MATALQRVGMYCQSSILNCAKKFFDFKLTHGIIARSVLNSEVNFLAPGITIPTAGFKRHSGVHRRCPDCRMLRVNNRLTVLCDTHPRHKQIQMSRRGQKRLHKTYPWRWPDPFDKKYGSPFSWDRYEKAFEK